jgi:hypothetical protein
MKVLREGHRYELENFENKGSEGQIIQFIEKEEKVLSLDQKTNSIEKSLVTINDGTTNEEVLEVLINRLQVLSAKLPSTETSIAIHKLEEALMWLNKRTQDRLKRGVEGTHQK